MLTIFTKNSIIDVWETPRYATDLKILIRVYCKSLWYCRGNLKTQLNWLELSAPGLFKYVWPFSGYWVLRSYSLQWDTALNTDAKNSVDTVPFHTRKFLRKSLTIVLKHCILDVATALDLPLVSWSMNYVCKRLLHTAFNIWFLSSIVVRRKKCPLL